MSYTTVKEWWTICRDIWRGKSVTRAYLNWYLRSYTLRGKTIDVGGGGGKNYLRHMSRTPDVEFLTFDMKVGHKIDFETDALPAINGSYDTVLLLNVLEHIFNHQHLLSEVVRITAPKGQLIGFVPFLMWYHPDHHDYFRYTHEALARLLAEAGAAAPEIHPIAKGPFVAAAQMFLLIVPRVLRVPVFTVFFLFDVIYLFFRKTHGEKYALGYLFIVKK
jgi:SAM-dependent methyltransferase